MQQYQQYIDDILGAVASPDTADPDFLRDSAAMYAEACAEANDRLRGVGRLLHRGLRSEAIQLAEQEPNLLDMVALLDFEELPTWRDMLVDWGMAEPPEILIEIAADLNKAYAEQQPLESLLRQHRILALARAPLSARIATLRKICTQDAGNEIWTSDLALLEKARLKQLPAEAEAARRTNDVTRLERINQEVNSSEWSIPLPAELTATIGRMHQTTAAQHARQTLAKLDVDLNDAHMAFDPVAGREARTEWNKYAAIAELSPTDELLQRAAPALEWLAEQDRQDDRALQRERAIESLRAGMDEHVDGVELQRRFDAASLFDEPVPEPLASQVRQRIRGHDIQIARRRRLIVGGSAGALIVLVAAGAYGIYAKRQADFASGAADSFKKLIDEDRLDDAEGYFANLSESSPGIVLRGEIQDQLARLKQKQAAEATRRADFENAIGAARESLQDEPDQNSLQSARQLALTEEEQAAVAEIEREFAVAQQALSKKDSEAYVEELGKLSDRLAELGRTSEADEQLLTALSNLLDEIRKLSSRFPRVDPAAVAQADPLEARINSMRKRIAAGRAKSEAKQQITTTVGDIGRFETAISDYSRQFPGSQVAANLPTIVDDLARAKGFLAWNTFLTDAFCNSLPADAEAARTALAEGQSLLQNEPGCSLAEEFERRQTYLKSIVQRGIGGGESIVDDLERLLRDPLIRDLWMVENKVGERFYCRKEPVATGGRIKFDYFVGFDLSEKPYSLREDDVVSSGPAPQSQLASRLRTLLEDIEKNGWEGTFVRMHAAATDSSFKLDPVLRLVVIKRIVEAGSSGSSILADAFSDYLKELAAANVDLTVPWMEPRNDDAERERRRAETAFSSLPGIRDELNAAAKRLRELQAPVDAGYRWIGWIGANDDGAPAVELKSLIPTSGRLHVVGRGRANSSSYAAQEIGKLTNGDVALSYRGADMIGYPVFYKPDSTK